MLWFQIVWGEQSFPSPGVIMDWNIERSNSRNWFCVGTNQFHYLFQLGGKLLLLYPLLLWSFLQLWTGEISAVSNFRTSRFIPFSEISEDIEFPSAPEFLNIWYCNEFGKNCSCKTFSPWQNCLIKYQSFAPTNTWHKAWVTSINYSN